MPKYEVSTRGNIKPAKGGRVFERRRKQDALFNDPVYAFGTVHMQELLARCAAKLGPALCRPPATRHNATTE